MAYATARAATLIFSCQSTLLGILHITPGALIIDGTILLAFFAMRMALELDNDLVV
jgi:small neutral amino acid transporter SnatA (MarC family)